MKSKILTLFIINLTLAGFAVFFTGCKPTAPKLELTGGALGIEQVARMADPIYESEVTDNANEVKWIQVDLGTPSDITVVKLYPGIGESWGKFWRIGFPLRFKIEASNDSDFIKPFIIVDHSKEDLTTDIPKKVEIFKTKEKVRGRYIRLTSNKLDKTYEKFRLAFYRIEIFSDTTNVAINKPLKDSDRGNLGIHPLTHAPRPMGDGIVTDHPENVTFKKNWKPIIYELNVPTNGVTLGEGPFKKVFEKNIHYLFHAYSVDDMLKQFRDRAGVKNPEGLRKTHKEWDDLLPGSSAGRFLMGAGNTLRWKEVPKLRNWTDNLIAEMKNLQRPDGYLMAYPEKDILDFENGAYCRAWVTHGLIDAGIAGNKDAYPMLRHFYDWFNKAPYLPELMRRPGQGRQGTIANTRLYLTPVGKPDDIQVLQRYYQENFWLQQLADRDENCIWKYPYDKPHSYLITTLEAYLDMYRVTGNHLYKDAALGGWDIYHDKFEHVGGSISICEGGVYPPKSYLLKNNTGELCGNVFWIYFNQRFHQLYPEEEKYVNEIEKSIYNVALSNQDDNGILYHAQLIGKKEKGTSYNTCCEGQGTRIFGALPEFIYSIAKDGLYVDLYSSSSINWKQNGEEIKLTMQTEFPYKSDVMLKIEARKSIKSKIRLRIPYWAYKNYAVFVNGSKVGIGTPGTYMTIDRTWATGDKISFNIPMGFKLTQYNGTSAGYEGKPAYALEYGPLLMAFTGKLDTNEHLKLSVKPNDIVKILKPVDGKPLHFTIGNDLNTELKPYWIVKEESFTCYPLLNGSEN